MKTTSPLHVIPLLPRCTSSIPLPRLRPDRPPSHTYTQPHTQTNEKQKLKELKTKQTESPPASGAVNVHRFWEPSITFETKFTIAVAGWSGSISANRWLTLSVVLPCFLATKPKNLGRKRTWGSCYSCVKMSKVFISLTHCMYCDLIQ